MESTRSIEIRTGVLFRLHPSSRQLHQLDALGIGTPHLLAARSFGLLIILVGAPMCLLAYRIQSRPRDVFSRKSQAKAIDD